MNAKYIASLVVLGLLVVVGFSSIFIVDEREQALVVKFGDPKRVHREPGLYLKQPFLEQVIYLDKRTLSLDVPPTEITASDQIRIVVDSFARYRIVDPLKRYQAATSDSSAERLLEKIMDTTVREVLGTEPKQDIVSGERMDLMQRISEKTSREAASIGLEIIDVRLKRVDLPKANSQAIFDRMESERHQEAAEIRAQGRRDAVKITADADRAAAVLVANAEKQSQIIRGEADGEAVKIFANAYNRDEEFFEFYRTMQAYRVSLGKDDTRLVLSPDSEFFKLFMDRK